MNEVRPARRHRATATTRTGRCSPTGHCAHVGRRHLGRRLHLQPEGEPGRRQDRLRAGADRGDAATARAGSGPGRWASRPPPRRPTPPRRSSKWATSKEYITLVGEEAAGSRHLRARASRPTTIPKYQKAAPFAKVVYDVDRQRRHHQADQGPGALYRHPVRGDPRVPGHRHARSASRSPRRSPARSTVDQALRDGADARPSATMKQAGYPEVS